MFARDPWGSGCGLSVDLSMLQRWLLPSRLPSNVAALRIPCLIADRCDGTSNILFVVQVPSGNVFGGYTTVEQCSSPAPVYHCDDDAYIFSLVNELGRGKDAFIKFDQQRVPLGFVLVD